MEPYGWTTKRLTGSSLQQIIGAWGEPALPAVAKYGDNRIPGAPHSGAGPGQHAAEEAARGPSHPARRPGGIGSRIGRVRTLSHHRARAVHASGGVVARSDQGRRSSVGRGPRQSAAPRQPVGRDSLDVGADRAGASGGRARSAEDPQGERQSPAARHRNQHLGLACHTAAERRGLEPVLQALIDVLESDSEAVVRMRAAAFLGGLGVRGRPALAALKKAEDDADPAVAREARQAVTRIAGIGEDDTSEHKARRPEEKMRPRLERKGAEPRPEPPKPSQPAP